MSSKIHGALAQMFSIPNLISMLRLGLVPTLLYAAVVGRATLFLILFCSLLLVGLADGFVARKLKQVTELGAELDSWGVFATYLVVPICTWMLWPELIRREATFVIAVLVFYFVPATLGLLKYGHLTSYHSWTSKFSAMLLGGRHLCFLWGDRPGPFAWQRPF